MENLELHCWMLELHLMLSYMRKTQKVFNVSLFTARIGAGLVIHDHKGTHEWFRSRKNFE